MAALEVCIILLPTHPPQMLTPSLEDDPGNRQAQARAPDWGWCLSPPPQAFTFCPQMPAKLDL